MGVTVDGVWPGVSERSGASLRALLRDGRTRPGRTRDSRNVV